MIRSFKDKKTEAVASGKIRRVSHLILSVRLNANW